uniref:Uncharacterized protein n=1 Tax=Anguilla anguilla TaxID=7936 RepID=A0A0E9WCW6_ANGAN
MTKPKHAGKLFLIKKRAKTFIGDYRRAFPLNVETPQISWKLAA